MESWACKRYFAASYHADEKCMRPKVIHQTLFFTGLLLEFVSSLNSAGLLYEFISLNFAQALICFLEACSSLIPCKILVPWVTIAIQKHYV